LDNFTRGRSEINGMQTTALHEWIDSFHINRFDKQHSAAAARRHAQEEGGRSQGRWRKHCCASRVIATVFNI